MEREVWTSLESDLDPFGDDLEVLWIMSSSLSCAVDGNLKSEIQLAVRVQELFESRGGRPGLSVLTSLMVSVDVRRYWIVLRHWSQFVPNMSTEDMKLYFIISCLHQLDVPVFSVDDNSLLLFPQVIIAQIPYPFFFPLVFTRFLGLLPPAVPPFWLFKQKTKRTKDHVFKSFVRVSVISSTSKCEGWMFVCLTKSVLHEQFCFHYLLGPSLSVLASPLVGTFLRVESNSLSGWLVGLCVCVCVCARARAVNFLRLFYLFWSLSKWNILILPLLYDAEVKRNNNFESLLKRYNLWFCVLFSVVWKKFPSSNWYIYISNSVTYNCGNIILFWLVTLLDSREIKFVMSCSTQYYLFNMSFCFCAYMCV